MELGADIIKERWHFNKASTLRNKTKIRKQAEKKRKQAERIMVQEDIIKLGKKTAK